MGDYQVLFSGEVTRGANADTVRERLAGELGIDERKARALFSGRTVVIRSQLEEGEARRLQHRLADLGAMCRIKSLAAPAGLGGQIDKDARRMEGSADQTLKDITAAHLECPRCSHFQLETSHCARCGVDIHQATAQKRKEDLLIQKKIRELRGGSASAPPRTRPTDHGGHCADARAVETAAAPPRKRASFVRELFRKL